MKREYEQFLLKIATDYGMDVQRRQAFMNPLKNSMLSNLIDNALKGLEAVSIATFDFKLTAIVKLLQSWIKDQKEKLEKEKSTAYKSDYYY